MNDAFTMTDRELMLCMMALNVAGKKQERQFKGVPSEELQLSQRIRDHLAAKAKPQAPKGK